MEHGRTLRVQHVPAGHPYVRSIAPDTVVLLPDPPVHGAPPGRWWPHPALELDWPGAHAGDVDVVHLHFGFEHRTAAQMRRWVAELRRAHIPLAVTVHDLRNPHMSDPGVQEALLDVVVPAADALTTLTPGAAAHIERRWGRRALVHPHPHVVAPEWLERPRPHRGPWTVGVHLKSLRANVDLDAVQAAAAAVADLPGAVLRVHVHRDVVAPSHPQHDARLTRLLARRGGRLDVRVHDPLDDPALWSDLLDTDLALLPYGFSTHSGWLEMCHDLGTDVLAADVGHLADQRPIRTYTDTGDVAAAVARAHADHAAGLRPARPAAELRRLERDAVRRLHLRVYRDLARGRR